MLDLYADYYPVYSWFGFAGVNGTVFAAAHGTINADCGRIITHVHRLARKCECGNSPLV